MKLGDIIVKNKRNFKGEGVYIGRPSPLGNPFCMNGEGDRERVIAQYKEWLKDEYQRNSSIRKMLRAMADTQEDLILICWCAPKPCHGDVIKDAVLSIREHGDIRNLY